MVKIACVCPPTADGQTRHPDGDIITLREKLGFHAATTVRQAVRHLRWTDPEASVGETLAIFTEQYLLFGIESWTLVDEKGQPVPVEKTEIRAFMEDHMEEAMTVGDACDEKYSEAVLLPLVTRGLNSSPDTPTDASTSPPTGSTIKPPTPSSPSSTTTSETDGIVTITPSLAGVSN